MRLLMTSWIAVGAVLSVVQTLQEGRQNVWRKDGMGRICCLFSPQNVLQPFCSSTGETKRRYVRSGKMGEGSSDSEGPQSLAALSHVPPPSLMSRAGFEIKDP